MPIKPKSINLEITCQNYLTSDKYFNRSITTKEVQFLRLNHCLEVTTHPILFLIDSHVKIRFPNGYFFAFEKQTLSDILLWYI